MTHILDENLQRIWGSIIVDELSKNDITNFYLAPGMRNAPILAACHKNPKINTYSFFDERALSYRALGRAKKHKHPVALSCTSGTAMANFLPAIIEAYKSNIPLIILTSDRPIEMVKIDANQTINQIDMFKEFCCYTIALEAPSESLTPRRLRTLMANAISRAKIHNKPVHINIPFREPLDNSKIKVSNEFFDLAVKSFEGSIQKNGMQFFNKIDPSAPIFGDIKTAVSPLLVIGKIDKQDRSKEYVSILKEINIPKYIDVTSGLKFEFNLEEGLNPSFDHPEVLSAYNENTPDLIIHVGGRLVSKHYYSFQEAHPEIKIIHITDFDEDHDPGFANNLKIICDPVSFLYEVSKLGLSSKPPIDWINFTQTKRDIIESYELSFPYLSKNIIEQCTGEIDLLIGNSTAIRSFDSYISPSHEALIHVYSNRGVSGIEGFNATLCGLSDEDNITPKVSIIGDVTFIHDLNSLLMYKDKSSQNITIIIVNNFGGGIFELLPISKERDFIHLLTTPHSFEFEKIIKAFDFLNYTRITNKDEFKEGYQKALNNNGVDILEIFINEEVNKEVYAKLKTVKR